MNVLVIGQKMTKILVVDDVLDNIRLLSFDLEDRGYEVLSALDGRQGLDIATAQRPDVILLDVMMPGMTGIEVCRRLKQSPETSMIPVILVTAMGLDDNVIAGLDAGADDYVSKPFRREVLAARIRAALRIKESYDTMLCANQQLKKEIASRERAEERYRVIFESSRDAVMTLAPPSWKFTSGNPATIALFETRDESEFTSLGPWNLSPEIQPDGRASAEKAKQMIETAMSEGSHFFEWTHKRLNGEAFPATVLLTRMELEGNLLLQATVRDITEQKGREAQIERLNRELVDASRNAGMAEVATGVLHNVGNVLNSVNVSTNVIFEKLRGSRVGRVSSVAALLDEHSDHLMDFLTADSRGTQLTPYLRMLGKHLVDEKDAVLQELTELLRNVEHVKEIINVQQAHSRVSGVQQVVRLDEVLDGAVKLNTASFLHHNVRIVREYAEVPPLTVDKHRLLQILVNLIGNAKDALKASASDDRRMILSIGFGHDDCLRVTVRDNGVGIRQEDMAKIFEHGFTTKQDGHGFGLHSSAIAATELGGSLSVHSDGAGCGATFRLEVPLTLAEPATCPA